MVRVGELTGVSRRSSSRLFGHIEFEREIKEKVTQALRYPMFVILVMGLPWSSSTCS